MAKKGKVLKKAKGKKGKVLGATRTRAMFNVKYNAKGEPRKS